MTKEEELTLEALKYATSLGNGSIVREMNIAPFVIRSDKALAQPWRGLTKKEIDSALSKYKSWYEFAAHLENILKEKNQ